MAILCPYCKDDLRVEMTVQFVDRVDESILTLYAEEFERKRKRAATVHCFLHDLIHQSEVLP